LSVKASENELRYWDKVHRKLSGPHLPSTPRRVTADTPAIVTRDDIRELLARVGNDAAQVVHLEDEDGAEAQPAAEQMGQSSTPSLAPPDQRSLTNLLAVDVVIESESTFYMISPHLQHNLQVRVIAAFFFQGPLCKLWLPAPDR
jgi:hypothetical protein